MEVEIRKAKKKDYMIVNDFMIKLHNLHAQNRKDLFDIIKDKYYTKKEYKKRLKNHKYYIANIDNKPVGLIEFKIRQYDRKQIVIDAIYVEEEYRKCEIGKKLVEKVLDFYNKNKKNLLGNIELQVFDFNENAISFYKKLGFSFVSHIMEFDSKNYENNK